MTASMTAGRRAGPPAGTVWRARHPAGESTILPDGCMDLIWTGRRVLVAGPDTGPYRYRADSAESMVGLRLPPGVAPGVLGHPAERLRDRRVDLADLWSDTEADRWCSLLSEADDPAAVLDDIARTRMWDAPAWLAPAAADLAAGVRVGECAERFGMTVRTFHRHSSRFYGYGPKTLQRILRMRAALGDLAAGRDLTASAYRHGYADEPHMHREFVELTGRGPSTFLRTTDVRA
ncbi:helix-turn-helix transcriptional regulator [Gordonia sp. SL306]|uniref:helix-turn-helix transcriptional regulator n=1 Tax=Gordonia sp. SL306 TaxID=2995145 RepID=UPI0022706B98|nr:helix-turn-helix domain-containing protein [Gordonia sp. SL306]WAC56132.1 helix-turn-helix domain-containing protein [Gordonia sp. SL306]